MTRTRVLGIAATVFFASTIALTVRTVQLSRRLDHAEVYVQSGSSSFFMVCSPVVSALRSGDVCPGLMQAAHACIGFLTRAEAEALGPEFVYKKYNAIADRIEDRLTRRQLPWHELDLSRSSMPEGY